MANNHTLTKIYNSNINPWIL